MNLSMADVVMILVAVIGGAAAISVVAARNVVHAALYLVVALLAVAGTFLALGAEFLAWAQVLVYVGAVIILILFGLMLTRAPIGAMAQHSQNQRMAMGISVALFGFLMTMIVMTFGTVGMPLEVTGAAALGEVLYVHWALPFMTLGFLLTVALIGAIVLARREEGEGPLPEDYPDLRRFDGEVSPSDVTSSPGPVASGDEVSSR